MRLFLKSFNIKSYENFEPTGEIICSKTQNIFLGANGAGKTQLLNLLGAMVNFNFSEISDKFLDVEYVLTLSGKENQNIEFFCDFRVSPAVNETDENGLPKGNKTNEENLRIELKINDVSQFIFSKTNGDILTSYKDGRSEKSTLLNSDFQSSFFNVIYNFFDTNNYSEISYFFVKIALLQIMRLSEKDEEFFMINTDSGDKNDKKKNFKILKTSKGVQLSQEFKCYYPLLAFMLIKYTHQVNDAENLLEKEVVFKDDLNTFFFDNIRFNKILSVLNAKSFKMDFNRIRKESLNDPDIIEYEYSGVKGELTFNSGTIMDWKWLTFGQKRFIVQSILLELRKDLPVVIDEISNGYHPKLLMELLRLIEDYQSFISSHNCMVLDAMPFVSSEELIRGIYIIRRDDNGKQTIKKFTDSQAKDIFEKSEVGIMNISQILEAEKIW